MAAVCGLALAASTVLACSGSGGSAKSFCQSLRTGPDPVALFADGGTSTDQMSAGIDRLRQLEAAAPSDVRGALGDLVAVATDLRDVLASRSQTGAGAPSATTPPADGDKAKKAADAVVTYASKSCAVDLAATTTSAPSTLVTPPSSG